MAKKVVGVYRTEEEVMQIVSQLEAAGYRPEDITMIAGNSIESAWLQNETGLDATTSEDLSMHSDRNEDESFWDKVKNFFMGESRSYDDSDGFTARFEQYGLTSMEAERYNEQVLRGNIVILAPDDYRASTATLGDSQPSEMNDAWDMENEITSQGIREREPDVVFLEDEDNDEHQPRRTSRNWMMDDENDRF